ncbi:unnamed protein product [Adineta steineri]|uniref:Uncharacterized protein n=1 Tax=Adineta steineri TaxID=433720 RepID=A0A815JM18_9BILA|nr:unnamed protein product [Adineta steineri]CAF1447810.1 unnamed protein product [Adineta steineri]CAF1456328.1 unnamed protein product [Adineta steineri]CAF3931356.1 unnamed protein product [Adineta steineri]CAF4037582.1 unnamed protein product [Adineta steineri]
MIQNYSLVWIDTNIGETKSNRQNNLIQFQSIINDTNVFTNANECVDFITDMDNEIVFLIISGTVEQYLVSTIYDITQINVIFIFRPNKQLNTRWTENYPKIQGVYTDIKDICNALQQAVKQSDRDTMAISFVLPTSITSDHNLNQLEPSFMYTQIFKEILFDLNYSQQSIKDFTGYCRDKYHTRAYQQNTINEFEHDYRPDQSIAWYTRDCFIYYMLNRGLRNLESEIIIKLGFFIHDLHYQIKDLHQQQFGDHHHEVFIVYRGQGLSFEDFEKLRKNKGCLMSFNNFLSTSKNREVSLPYARRPPWDFNSIGILFKITINPSISSTPFALIDDVSYFDTEQEILFSMHTIFRTGEMKILENNDCLYEVELQLTADNDLDLLKLTEQIRKEIFLDVGLLLTGDNDQQLLELSDQILKETFPVKKGWIRMGKLLIKLGHLHQAEQIYSVILEQMNKDEEKAYIYYQLGWIKIDQGNYTQAISFYEKAIKIYEKANCSIPILLINCYNNIGEVYRKMGEYIKALRYNEKVLEIKEKTLPSNNLEIATSYNNIGLVYRNMDMHSKALSCVEKSLKIRQKILPPNHPLLAQSYSNTGWVYDNMKEYSKALRFYEKCLEIQQKTLPSTHFDLATTYHNIAALYMNMGDYSKAISSYEKDLEIQEKILPSDHPDFAEICNNMGWAYKNMREYSKALLYYERTLNILRRSLPSNHPDIRNVQKHIDFSKKHL